MCKTIKIQYRIKISLLDNKIIHKIIKFKTYNGNNPKIAYRII